MVTFVIGLAMVGGEFLTVARLLDWAEVRLRTLAHLVEKVWRSSTLGKVMLVSLALILVTAFGYVVYSVLFAA